MVPSFRSLKFSSLFVDIAWSLASRYIFVVPGTPFLPVILYQNLFFRLQTLCRFQHQALTMTSSRFCPELCGQLKCTAADVDAVAIRFLPEKNSHWAVLETGPRRRYEWKFLSFYFMLHNLGWLNEFYKVYNLRKASSPCAQTDTHVQQAFEKKLSSDPLSSSLSCSFLEETEISGSGICSLITSSSPTNERKPHSWSLRCIFGILSMLRIPLKAFLFLTLPLFFRTRCFTPNVFLLGIIIR